MKCHVPVVVHSRESIGQVRDDSTRRSVGDRRRRRWACSLRRVSSKWRLVAADAPSNDAVGVVVAVGYYSHSRNYCNDE